MAINNKFRYKHLKHLNGHLKYFQEKETKNPLLKKAINEIKLDIEKDIIENITEIDYEKIKTFFEKSYVKNKIKNYIEKIKLNDKMYLQELVKEQSYEIQSECIADGIICEIIEKYKDNKFNSGFVKKIYEEMMLEKVILKNFFF